MSAEAITRLLEEAGCGRQEALDELVELLHTDLHRSARALLSRRYGAGLDGSTLEPSALVNEAYLRLIRQRSGFANRDHFLAIATRVMLRFLADYERGKRRDKRGAGAARITLAGVDEELAAPATSTIEDFAEALERLDALASRPAEIAKMVFVWGCTVGEVAEVLDLSERTVERDLRFARAWLQDALAEDAR
ncbi:MAG TPA: ECF-type sigma factor [Steroidobacteraceae bacterium]|nr:ECF-type sigma factor [Steroidobacteraceae bacterium]